MTAFTTISTTAHALTSTPYTFDPDSGVFDPNANSPRLPWLIRVWADVAFHARMDGSDATTNDMPVAAGLNGVILGIPAGGSLSVIKQSAASNGNVFFSHIKRT